MTDLKQLLDDAAGPEPAVTDTDLATDLTRGRRALHRRRITGIAGAAVATGLVAGVGWAVLPAVTAHDTIAPAARPTPSVTASKPAVTPTQRIVVPGGDPNDHRPPPPVPSTPVTLVANSKPFPGKKITCDLIPTGWAVRVRTEAGWEQQELYDPNLRNPKQYHDPSYTMVVRQVEMTDNGEGLTADKYTAAWTKLPKVRAGQKEAVISLGTKRNGLREVHVRQGTTTHLIAVANNAYNLGWNEATLLRFAGSCHYK
ncbi:hypothetical protein [Kribbella sp.]|uniref:hypothetical protein n=1 Tax=Kribbella sp. TaxID=1871183 RepID=UPI002D4801BE|nr:hypothetical protein [Kribbella sp.]HZX03625.1 hypothetical protein [Kribbella sp.]